ncbi:MAG: glutamate-1-semialdehyde 2,1-aminomutase [Opitutales bacterium]
MKSRELFERALKLIPGGVNSPVRAFKSVGSSPFFTKRAEGACLYTEDDVELVDFVNSWGPALFGHNHPAIKQKIAEALESGTSFGTPNAYEVEMAELICSRIDSIDMVRMVNSGTEATMSAIRLARGYTKRDKIIKFEGCYHGHTDSLLVKAGSGILTFSSPDSAGIPQALADLTIVLEYNNIEQVEEAFAKYKDEIAGVIVEPYPANVGLLKPKAGFLEKLRSLCTANGSVLIFDEVITGFRFGRGGAQAKTGIQADLTTLGKIIGGGMPVGAFGGKAEIMQCLSPLGSVYQAGTLSGNPLCMAAGIASIRLIDELKPYETLRGNTKKIAKVIADSFAEKGIAVQVHSKESLTSVFFSEKEIFNCKDVLASDSKLYSKYFHNCLSRGLYLAPSAFECMFTSLECNGAILDRACNILQDAIKDL